MMVMRSREPHDTQETLSVEQAAKLLGIGRNSAYQAAKRGEIPAVRVGRRLLIPHRRLLRFIDGEQQSGSREHVDGRPI